jgi:hypothetical protein
MAITAEKLFATQEMFTQWSSINGSVDWKLVTSHMVTAQDIYLQRYLGTALYSKLKTDFNAWSGNYLTLVDTYVRKVVMWWTLKEAMPNLRVKINNGNLTIYQGEDFTGATEQDMKRLIDQCLKNAQYYTQLMVDYLCYNSSLFPEYTSNTGTQRPPVTNVYGNVEIGISRNMRNATAMHPQDFNSINVYWS